MPLHSFPVAKFARKTVGAYVFCILELKGTLKWGSYTGK